MKPKTLSQATLKPNWDAPTNVHAFTVLKDRALPAGLPETPRRMIQVHQDNVINWDHCHYQKNIEADASFTTQSHIICTIGTADCLPILITDHKASLVAAIHAGWRGLAKKIISKTLNHITCNNDILVWIGPGIGPCHYTVGAEVFDAFDFAPAFIAITDNQWSCDLYALAEHELIKNGVPKDHIFSHRLCSFEDPIHLESYRRDQKHAGRMLTMIWKSL